MNRQPVDRFTNQRDMITFFCPHTVHNVLLHTESYIWYLMILWLESDDPLLFYTMFLCSDHQHLGGSKAKYIWDEITPDQPCNSSQRLFIMALKYLQLTNFQKNTYLNSETMWGVCDLIADHVKHIWRLVKDCQSIYQNRKFGYKAWWWGQLMHVWTLSQPFFLSCLQTIALFNVRVIYDPEGRSLWRLASYFSVRPECMV